MTITEVIRNASRAAAWGRWAPIMLRYAGMPNAMRAQDSGDMGLEIPRANREANQSSEASRKRTTTIALGSTPRSATVLPAEVPLAFALILTASRIGRTARKEQHEPAEAGQREHGEGQSGDARERKQGEFGVVPQHAIRRNHRRGDDEDAE